MENNKDFATQIIENDNWDYPEQEETQQDIQKAVEIVNNEQDIVSNELSIRKNSLNIYTAKTIEITDRLNNMKNVALAIKQALKSGINSDYAIIPGTTKPTLLQPGARKICLLFGFKPTYKLISTNNNTIITECTLKYGNEEISSRLGACKVYDMQDWEYLKQIAEEKHKTPPAKPRDYSFEFERALGMSQKRALVGATLGISNMGEVFTQDMEDTAEGQAQKPKYIQHTSEEWNEIKSALKDYVETKYQAKITKYNWKKYFIEFSKLFNEFKATREQFKDKQDIFDIIKDKSLSLVFKQYWLGLNNEVKQTNN